MSDEIREPTYLVLAALADQPRHGYAIIGEIETMTSGRITLRAGTLYAALDRLTAGGWVSESGQEVVNGRLRRYYTLTTVGVEVLAEQTERLMEHARQATHRLQLRKAEA